ncbi:zinc finger MYND domain-containing protein 15 isoform X2 [Morus notabilis]|uniref:zinc finger MYND domain-containing protein 15 isoform X2 n=1 Tax=Morus notabilis TaxID=981085 RepID=UPI000CECFB72|nr:zinc finger MYND domain-containing protein 15 isoform X2 [Morus notabilis]
MECAWKGRATRCVGPARRRCGSCGAVAYCSASHQISHWSEHKEECKRLEEQMKHIDVLNEFPFTFSVEATVQVCEKQVTRCSFLSKRNIHQLGMWLYECHCGTSLASFDSSRLIDSWDLPDILCPCKEPESPISKHLSSWKEYYEWRCIPLNSPVALLLHWPLTIYHAVRTGLGSRIFEIYEKLHIHYLGPEKELLQLAVFAELHVLFPGLDVHIELVGPAVPQSRDGECITLCKYARCLSMDCVCKSSECVSWDVHTSKTSIITLNLRKGFYHDRYRDMAKDSFPHLIIAPNAGIAAYPSWLPTILIKEMNIPAIFSDYCEEACNLGASCITSVTGCPLARPIQLNPFRQPVAVEGSALFLPCYSNCFLYGM